MKKYLFRRKLRKELKNIGYKYHNGFYVRKSRELINSIRIEYNKDKICNIKIKFYYNSLNNFKNPTYFDEFMIKGLYNDYMINQVVFHVGTIYYYDSIDKLSKVYDISGELPIN